MHAPGWIMDAQGRLVHGSLGHRRYPADESYGYTLASANALVLQNVNCLPGAGGVCVFNFVRIV